MIWPLNTCQICAIMTTYRPGEGLADGVERLRSQVGLVVIVDDGGCEENVASLREWFGDLVGVVLHHNLMNVGIAKSLNEGISIAKRKGFRWVLTLDDDT